MNSESIQYEKVPSKEMMVEWTQKIFNQGIRRPGYSADKRTEKWIQNTFQNFGLKDIILTPINIKKWEFKNPVLKIWSKEKPDDIKKIPCFPIPYTRSSLGVEGELCKLSDNTNITDKILVDELKLFKFPVNTLKKLLGRNRYYDPDNEFETLEQIVPFDMRFQSLFESMVNQRPKGFIGILSGFPWETDKYYVPYDAIQRDLPGIWVSKKNGKKIIDLMDEGNVVANLSYEGFISNDISHNISGVLPANSKYWIIIGSHHDGPWNSAVEDASGISLVLAQAKYWSQIPKEKRPFNLMFLLTSAHMAGGLGAKTFVNTNKKFLEKVITAIHLEHVARDVKTEYGERLIPLKNPTVRWWFVSRIMALEEATEQAIIEEDLRRSVFPPIDGFIPGTDKPPTDGAFYHPAGVPLISFLTAPPYLFDPADTMDKIHEESFEPLTRAIIRIISSLKGYTVEDLRSQVLSRSQRNKAMRSESRKN